MSEEKSLDFDNLSLEDDEVEEIEISNQADCCREFKKEIEYLTKTIGSLVGQKNPKLKTVDATKLLNSVLQGKNYHDILSNNLNLYQKLIACNAYFKAFDEKKLMNVFVQNSQYLWPRVDKGDGKLILELGTIFEIPQGGSDAIKELWDTKTYLSDKDREAIVLSFQNMTEYARAYLEFQKDS